MSQIAWSTALLRLLKAPETPANYRFLNAWATREHGDPALSDGSNNPFFTTAGGSSTLGPFKSGTFPYWNSIGVAKYPNLGVGVYANALHIQTGYPSIAAALKSGNPAAYANDAGFQRDLTRWSGSGYSSVMNVGGAAGPVGATLDPANIGKDVIDAAGSGGGSIGGAINSAARHIPGVAQIEGAVSAAGAVAGFLGKLTDPHYILRGLQIIAGAGLVITGAGLLARQVALAADLPDPLLLAGPAGKAGAVVAGAAAAQTPARREGRKIEDAATEANGGKAPRAAREGVPRRYGPSVDAETGMTRAQAREARDARRARRDAAPVDDIPF